MDLSTRCLGEKAAGSLFLISGHESIFSPSQVRARISCWVLRSAQVPFLFRAKSEQVTLSLEEGDYGKSRRTSGSSVSLVSYLLTRGRHQLVKPLLSSLWVILLNPPDYFYFGAPLVSMGDKTHAFPKTLFYFYIVIFLKSIIN